MLLFPDPESQGLFCLLRHQVVSATKTSVFLEKKMTLDIWLIIGVFVLGGGALIGIFATKTPGFGRYTTSVLLLVLVFVVSGMCLAAGKIDSSLFGHVLFAVAGFAGGLLTNRPE